MTVTAGGIRQWVAQRRKEWRVKRSYGIGKRVEWDRQAMSKYTQLRTNRGGLGSWLHTLGRRDSPECTHCRGEDETGDHVVFSCRRPDRLALRRKHIPGVTSWEGLDKPIVVRDPERGRPRAGEKEEEEPDQVYLFFRGIAFGLWEEEGDEDG